MDFIYAQLDENKVCIGISQLAEEVKDINLIKLDSYDISLLGKKYSRKKWIEVVEETPESEG